MGAPSVIKIKKDHVEYTSSAELAKYTIAELTRAALKDVGKFVAKRTRQKIKKRSGKLARNIQYWVRKRETDLQIGFKPGGFYGGFQELGTKSIPKQGLLQETVMENIDEIRKIESMYLKHIEDPSIAKALIEEREEIGEDE